MTKTGYRAKKTRKVDRTPIPRRNSADFAKPDLPTDEVHEIGALVQSKIALYGDNSYFDDSGKLIAGERFAKVIPGEFGHYQGEVELLGKIYCLIKFRNLTARLVNDGTQFRWRG